MPPGKCELNITTIGIIGKRPDIKTGINIFQ